MTVPRMKMIFERTRWRSMLQLDWLTSGHLHVTHSVGPDKVDAVAPRDACLLRGHQLVIGNALFSLDDNERDALSHFVRVDHAENEVAA